MPFPARQLVAALGRVEKSALVRIGLLAGVVTILVTLAQLAGAVTAPDAQAQTSPCVGGIFTANQLNESPNGDWDADGMTNLGEVQIGLNPCLHSCRGLTNLDLQVSPHSDWDSDGVSNLIESQQGSDPCAFTTFVPSSSGAAPQAPTAVPRAAPVPTPPPQPTRGPTPTAGPTSTPEPTPTSDGVVVDFDALKVTERERAAFARTLDPTPVPTASPTAVPTPEPTAAPTVGAVAAGVISGDSSSPDGIGETADEKIASEAAPITQFSETERTACTGVAFDGQCLRWAHLSLVVAGSASLVSAVIVADTRRRREVVPSLTFQP